MTSLTHQSHVDVVSLDMVQQLTDSVVVVVVVEAETQSGRVSETVPGTRLGILIVRRLEWRRNQTTFSRGYTKERSH